MRTNENLPEKEIARVAAALSQTEEGIECWRQDTNPAPLPSVMVLDEIVDLLRSVLFVGYFEASHFRPKAVHFHVGATLEKVFHLLAEQVQRGLCFVCDRKKELDCADCQRTADELTSRFISDLPRIRQMLSTDVKAAYDGDPAAITPGEAIFCYPSIKALMNFRIANALNKLGVPLIPRIITEEAHSATGIDIHPGAEIGESFFMDHGTGVVIGETCVIGKKVTLYQGVTLGAKNFPVDTNGNPVKGVPRHPIVEDNVTVYSGATILGRVTIGKGSVIGGNVWLTRDVPAGSKIFQGGRKENGEV